MRERGNSESIETQGGSLRVFEGEAPDPLKLLTKHDTATLLHVRTKTLENWRVRGVGPRFVRLGGPRGRVLYREVDVQAYLEAAVRRSTSDKGPPPSGIESWQQHE